MKKTLLIINLYFFILNFPKLTFAEYSSYMPQNNSEEIIYNMPEAGFQIYQNSNEPIVEKPDQGQCVAQYESKTYITPIEQGKEVQFTCRYLCVDNNNSIHKVIVTHRLILSSNYVESVKMVCDGVVMDSKRIGENSVYVPVKILAFYATESTRSEIIEWKKKYNIKIPNNIYQAKITEFNSIIRQVANSLMYSGRKSNNTDLINAADVLIEISNQTIRGKQELKESLTRIRLRNTPDLIWKKIVDMYIEANGRFLLD